MTGPTLLEKIEKSGLILSVDENTLRVQGKKEALTPARLKYLKQHKGEIIQVLQKRALSPYSFPSPREAMALFVKSKEEEFNTLGTELEERQLRIMKGEDLPEAKEIREKHKRLLGLAIMLERWKKDHP